MDLAHARYAPPRHKPLDQIGLHVKQMTHLDDLPKLGPYFCIHEQSVIAFRNAISSCKEFVIQSEILRDYGTDYWIEAIEGGRMTNVKVCVQLKGTGQVKNIDGSVSVSIKRTNWNYLFMSPGSLLVCYHSPTERLLVKQADDLTRICERKSDQSTITIQFSEEFNEDFQRRHRKFVVASAKENRDIRYLSRTCQPEIISARLSQEPFNIHIPSNQKEAGELLIRLYKDGRDKTISRSFEKFRTTLGPANNSLIYAYMSEINLGMNNEKCNQSRILKGINVINKAVRDEVFPPGSMLYCIANGWFARSEYEKAAKAYHLALDALIEEAEPSKVIAQCYKNLGSTLERLNRPDEACHFYNLALESDAELAEAHFALALWNHRNGDFQTAISHLDKIIWPRDSAGTQEIVSGWRTECLFELDRVKEAIREIRGLLSVAEEFDWIWPWCAKLVAKYGNASQEALEFSIKFWNRYLEQNAGDTRAKIQRLLCVWHLHSNFGESIWNYHEFKRNVLETLGEGISNTEFFLFRIGLWAQKEENWTEAEKWYRKAYDHCPEEYGYYLGTALNHLNRYEEALQILLPQAREHYPDELSWFQVAIAMEGVGNTEGCIKAYERVLKLDETYAEAWFNLGGVYCNSGQEAKAMEIWTEAILRFPEHESTARLKADLPGIFGP